MITSILFWLGLVLYLLAASLGFMLIGINWYTLETKYKRSPLLFVIPLCYLTNFLVLQFGFRLPVAVQFVTYSLQMTGIYFGTVFQCIGLTGGIATGKSTVSSILAESGFDIIDADKISKEVRIASMSGKGSCGNDSCHSVKLTSHLNQRIVCVCSRTNKQQRYTLTRPLFI